MGYGWEIRRQFAKAYARNGNATHALKMVLGEERAEKMQPHTLRAKASELLNDYRTVELIEQEKAEMQQRGETLPHYRLRTWRADLLSGEPYQPPKPLPRPFVISRGMKGLFKEVERLKRSITKPDIFLIRNKKIL